MVNKNKFEKLSKADQKALLKAGRDTEIWLKPKYESWVDERVGNAVMKGGGAAVSVSEDERMNLINSVQSKWQTEVESACGSTLANKVSNLFAKYAP